MSPLNGILPHNFYYVVTKMHRCLIRLKGDTRMKKRKGIRLSRIVLLLVLTACVLTVPLGDPGLWNPKGDVYTETDMQKIAASSAVRLAKLILGLKAFPLSFFL